MSTLERAIQIATETHNGQFDKTGSRGFSPKVIAALRCVTKTSENENYAA